MAWSGGKDSSLALNKIKEEGEFDVKYLLTTLNAEFKRVSMHGTEERLLDAQSKSLGIPLIKVWIHEASYEEYEKQMRTALEKAAEEGIQKVAFGDIFLEDLKKYREDKMAEVGMEAIFPLWKRDTKELAQQFIAKGFHSIICCINDAYLDESFVGRELNQSFVDSLPSHVDYCGENGEYHSFCYDGPIFNFPVQFETEEKVYKPLQVKESDEECNTEQKRLTKGFWYINLIGFDATKS